MPSRSGALSGTVVLRIATFVASRGHDPVPLFRCFGLSLEALQDRRSRVPYPVVEALGLRAATLTGVDHIGLHLAQVPFETDTLDPMLLMLMATGTLRQAFELLVRFQRYWGDGERLVLIALGDGMLLRTAYPFGRPGTRHSDECALAELVLGIRFLTGAEILPRVVRFQHEPPRDVREHQALFRCALEFSCEHSELVLDDATLDLRSKAAHAHFLSLFRRQVERTLASIPSVSSVADDVRRAVASTLAQGLFSLKRVANVLRTSPRTLQRRLREEGTSFDEVVETLRHTLARTYLDRRVSIEQISALLGYSDASAFHHAFKRWTGTSPEQSRSTPPHTDSEVDSV